MVVLGLRDNKTTFGWNHSTHKLITNKLVGKYNPSLPKAMKFDYEILKYSCVDPDFSRKNITKYIHGHFADIDNLSNDPPDAYSLAIRYTNQAIEANKKGHYKKRDDYVGYALHFIQDMLNPMHVSFAPLPKAHPERLFHKHFEKIAEEMQGTIIKTTTINELDAPEQFFEMALPSAMRTAKNLLEKIKINDYTNVSEIAVAAIDNTYKTTNLYFKKLVEEFIKK